MTSGRNVVVGILAGGQGSRLGGADKGWIERAGRAQIERVLDAMHANAAILAGAGLGRVERIVVSANRNLERYRALGVDVVTDRDAGSQGPMAGLARLAEECETSHADAWLLTLPVDVASVPDNLFPRMLATADADDAPVIAVDDDGRQPLIALYPPAHASAAAKAYAAGERSVSRWQETRAPQACAFAALRFGNINTPADMSVS